MDAKDLVSKLSRDELVKSSPFFYACFRCCRNAEFDVETSLYESVLALLRDHQRLSVELTALQSRGVVRFDPPGDSPEVAALVRVAKEMKGRPLYEVWAEHDTTSDSGADLDTTVRST